MSDFENDSDRDVFGGGRESQSNESFGSFERATIGRSGFSLRAERLLVRVLLALRCETKRSTAADQRRAEQRAEELADVILADFPRRVIPFGIAALALIAILCSLPLARDIWISRQSDGTSASAALVVEHGIRSRGEVVSDGLETLRSVIAPFAADADAPQASGPAPTDALPSDAAAPFKRS